MDAFIDMSFRDVADEDYIAARIAYRYDLLQPFFWSSLQAIEKYLKAILLYHRENTRELGHDINAAFERVAPTLEPAGVFPDDVGEFVKYINEEGPNRYLGCWIST